MTEFNMSFKEFKAIAKSAKCIKPYPIMDATMVDATRDGVVFEAIGDGHELWRVAKSATAINNTGRFFIPTDALDLICKLKLKATQDTIRFVADNDTFTVYTMNGKKIDMAVARFETDNFGTMPKINEYCARFGMKDFATMCDNMSNFVDASNANRVMQGIYFDWKNSRVVALEGHKIIMRDIADNMSKLDGKENAIFNLVNNYKVVKSITSEAGKVNVYTDKKYVYLYNDSFMLRTRAIDAVYFQYEKIIDVPYTLTARVDRNQMLDIADYDYSVLKNLKAPMVFDIAGGKVTARSDKARVQDQIYTDHVSGEWEEFGLNAQYVKDTMSILSDDIITIHGVNPKSPFFFSDGETYSILLLPVIIQKTAA